MKAFLTAALIVFISLTSFANWNLEKQKIDFLIDSVEHLNATFVRNGDDHTGPEAAKHLRRKVKFAVRGKSDQELEQLTVNQFIDEIASQSTFTGNPYTIRFPNGTEVSARAWLYQQLQQFHPTN